MSHTPPWPPRAFGRPHPHPSSAWPPPSPSLSPYMFAPPPYVPSNMPLQHSFAHPQHVGRAASSGRGRGRSGGARGRGSSGEVAWLSTEALRDPWWPLLTPEERTRLGTTALFPPKPTPMRSADRNPDAIELDDEQVEQVTHEEYSVSEVGVQPVNPDADAERDNPG